MYLLADVSNLYVIILFWIFFQPFYTRYPRPGIQDVLAPVFAKSEFQVVDEKF